MAKWINTLDVSDVWDKADEGEITVAELARVVHDRLTAIPAYSNADVEYERQTLIEEFESLADDEDSDFDAFNYSWDRLYDWGDTSLDTVFNGRKVCWLKVFI